MPHRCNKLISLTLCVLLLLEQAGFAQTVSLNLANYLSQAPKPAVSDTFRPLHLRYLSYDNLNQDFKILLDKGDFLKESPGHQVTTSPEKQEKALESETQNLLRYFFIGLALPNDKFWVNLRPDAPDNIIDDDLAKTDIGRIFLEADVQLKKDTAQFTSPQTPEGKAYWDKLYQKAGELFGTENITIPTLTRPWIVPNEIIIREAPDNAYIYKATLKVMLEEDYLKSSQLSAVGYQQYEFKDQRLKELNQYSTQLIKELIIPKLTYQVNTSKRYAPLRQVYYSLILAQWFKQVTKSQGHQSPEQNNPYIKLIDSGDLTNLTAKEPYDKQDYFKQYQKSFKDGEYNLQEPVHTPLGQSIRRYMSGGIKIMGNSVSSAIEALSSSNRFTLKASYLSPLLQITSSNKLLEIKVVSSVASSAISDNKNQNMQRVWRALSNEEPVIEESSKWGIRLYFLSQGLHMYISMATSGVYSVFVSNMGGKLTYRGYRYNGENPGEEISIESKPDRKLLNSRVIALLKRLRSSRGINDFLRVVEINEAEKKRMVALKKQYPRNAFINEHERTRILNELNPLLDVDIEKWTSEQTDRIQQLVAALGCDPVYTAEKQHPDNRPNYPMDPNIYKIKQGDVIYIQYGIMSRDNEEEVTAEIEGRLQEIPSFGGRAIVTMADGKEVNLNQVREIIVDSGRGGHYKVDQEAGGMDPYYFLMGGHLERKVLQGELPRGVSVLQDGIYKGSIDWPGINKEMRGTEGQEKKSLF